MQWAENHARSERLKLTDLMMTPIQRITRYNLLLDKILGYTENETQISEIQEMVNFNVFFFKLSSYFLIIFNLKLEKLS